MAVLTASWQSVLLTTVAAVVVYLGGLLAYRLVFSPLAKYPGPKLAAATLWYEFYYDVVLKGRWPFKVAELHKQYGPIVRINPSELHIDDVALFDELYIHRKQDRFEWWTAGGEVQGSTLMTILHEHHRLRRKAFQPFFSKSSMMSRIHYVHAKVAKLRERIEKAQGQVIRLDLAYIALTADLITELFFGYSMNNLDLPNFAEEWHSNTTRNLQLFAISRHFQSAMAMLGMLPVKVLLFLAPSMAGQVAFRQFLQGRVDTVVADHAANAEKRKQLLLQKGVDEKTKQPTVFHTILDSDLVEPEKSNVRMEQEALTILSAGTGPTARALGLITTHILLESKPSKMQSELYQELKTIMPSPDDLPTLQQLEALPYLTAVVKEGVRLGPAVVSRNPRVLREPLEYGGYVIPAGVPVSQNMDDVLMNPTIFADPVEFRPERWLRKTADGKWELHGELDKYLVSFGKGTRQCIGIHLAWMEMYYTLAMVFRRFQLELHETDYSDIEYKHDFFGPHPRLDSNGIQVKVVSILD